MAIGLDGHAVGRRATGNETYVVGLAAGLSERPDVALTLYVDPGVHPDGIGPRARIRQLRFRQAQPRIALELPLRARLDRLDLLHVQYVVPPAPGAAIATTIHDVSYLDVPWTLPARRRWRLRLAVADAVRRSAVVIVPSAFSRERLLHHYAIAPERVAVAAPVMRTGPGASRPASPEAAGSSDAGSSEADGRLLAGLGITGPFALAVGDSYPRKNLPRLVAAMAEVRRNRPDLELVIVGQRSWAAEELEAALDQHAARRWTRTVGYVDGPTLHALYARAVALAYVSLYEGFGIPVIEAMRAGTPVVTSSRTATREVAGDAAVLVDPTDVRDIAAGIERAAGDGALRATLVAAGRRRATAYEPEVALEATLEAYRTALDR